MNNKQIIIYGAGALGRLCFELFQNFKYEVSFFIDQFLSEQEILGRPVYRIEDAPSKNLPVYICVSYENHKIKKQLQKAGFSQVNYLKDFEVHKLSQKEAEILNKKTLENLKKVIINTKIKEIILVIDTKQEGGAEEYFKEFTNKLENKEGILIIKNFPLWLSNLELLNFDYLFRGRKINSGVLYDLKILEEIVSLFGIKKVIINRIHTYPFTKILSFLTQLKKFKNLFITYNLHDFLCICPTIFLVNFEGFFCNIPGNRDYCQKCLNMNKWIEIKKWLQLNKNFNKKLIEAEGKLINDINLWRKKFGDFFKEIDKVVCFSESSKEILLRVYPFLSKKIKVKPHEVTWVRPVNFKKKGSDFNIGVLGDITFVKGSEVILSMVEYLKKKKLNNIKIHIFGRLINNKTIEKNKFLVLHGPYKKETLPELMEKNEIDIIFIPSICPETFCYTVEEAIKMELPVAVFDIGAPSERVKKYKKGIILDYNRRYEPEYILTQIYNKMN